MPVQSGEGSKAFFFEKKNQKTFILEPRRVSFSTDRREHRRIKSFLLLFFKKEVLAFARPLNNTLLKKATFS
jgi:hypothetical protein